MKFLASVSALAAFAASALAQTADFDPIFTPESGENVPAGQDYEITWEAPATYAAGTISLHLIGGATQDTQVPLADIAAGIPNSDAKYTWAVDASLGAEAVYGLVIKLESNPAIFQYSNPFHIVKSEGGDEKGEKTMTISKDYGVKTVTLSSCEPTTTSTSSVYTPEPVTSTTPIYTPPVYTTANATTSYVKPTTIQTQPAPTTVVDVVPSQPATVPDTPGAGARFGASSVALVGAFVVAAFAL
jgi:hypothetical protein